MPEEQLEDVLLRLRSDDETVLREIFQANYLPVCQTINRFIRDRSLVEDLAQEVFVRLWEKRHQLNITSSLKAYLRRMAINEALAYLRKHKNYSEQELTPETQRGASESAEGAFLQTELEERIKSAIDGLPPRCRAIFQLSRYEELTYKEIADQLDISVKTVENQMGKALKLLREQLRSYLGLFL